VTRAAGAWSEVRTLLFPILDGTITCCCYRQRVVHVDHGIDPDSSRGQCSVLVVLDIVGLLKTLLYRRGQSPCCCNACTSDIPRLQALLSPKWIPKTAREIVCTPKHAYLQSRSEGAYREPVF
jgi:hypothetical protein